jgi:phosphatidylserine decarboxylase
MDSFVVISFGKKVFHTRVILNPTWGEKLLFHMRAYESAFRVQLTVLDWDNLLSDDHVGDAGFMVADLMVDAPQRDENTGLYGEEADRHGMKEFMVLLLSSSDKGAAL